MQHVEPHSEWCEQGLHMRTHRRRGENSSVGSREEQPWGPQPGVLWAVSPVQQWWGWRERWFFSCMLPHYLLYAFFPNRINPNSLFVAWLRLSTVIREIVAHWPLTSCTHVLLANISVFKIPFNSIECTSTALLFQLSPTQASTSKTRYEKVGGKGWLSHQW